MANFNGTLKSNEIFGALYNMILSQEVYADNIKDTKSTLVDMARVDGGLYGDQKLFYATDCLQSMEWTNDAESNNLLKLYRPEAPKCQAIVLDVFRYIACTVDNYLSKRAFSTEGAFSQFNSVILGWIRETKKIYDSTTYNTFIGTTVSTKGKQSMEIDVASAVGDATGEAAARLEGEAIAKAIALLLVDLQDISRDYNDYGYVRSYALDDLIFVWNSDAVAKIEKVDLPSLYHKDIVDRFAEYTLPGRYFGDMNDATKEAADAKTRSAIEQDIVFAGGETVAEPIQINRAGAKMVLSAGETVLQGDIGHVFAGDAIPAKTVIAANSEVIYPSYQVNGKILFKVMNRRSVPMMSSFEVANSFFNQASLTETQRLIWAHNTLEYLKNYPFITVKEK